MARSPLAFPALLLVLASAVLLFLCTFSTSFVWSIFFLQNNRPSGGNARFGVFGWCVAEYCSPRQLGWTWSPQVSSEPTLMRTLVLVPIAAGFSTLAFLALIYCVQSAGKAAGPTLLLALLAFLSSGMGLAFVFGIFKTAKDRFSSDGEGVQASFGPAAWMMVAATASLFLGLLLIYFGPYKRATDYEMVENRTGVVVTQPPVQGSKWSRRFKKADQSQSYNV